MAATRNNYKFSEATFELRYYFIKEDVKKSPSVGPEEICHILQMKFDSIQVLYSVLTFFYILFITQTFLGRYSFCNYL